MANKIIPKKIIKDILIVGVGVLAIWIGLQAVFGTQNPFYVVASGSMVPVLEVYDVLVVQGHDPFKEIEIGDIIVFNRPSDHNRVIVHRVVSIIDENPKIIRTQGDANPASIPGTDFPISEEEYIGKVVFTLPQVGYVTQVLKPPTNYIIIAIVIGVMVVKQMMGKKKKEKITDLNFQDSLDSENPDIKEELSDINEIEKDSEYSKHENNIDFVDEKSNSDETKTDDFSEKEKKE
ncbi:MAG: signal peptidase I [Thaumarchaeota archaeon]|nr:MAG: signal peptidase I [Nitrososphaerota archaeon]